MHIMIETNTTDCHNLDKNPTEGTCFEKLYYSHTLIPFRKVEWQSLHVQTHPYVHMDVR